MSLRSFVPNRSLGKGLHFVSLVVNGLLTGTIYALIALAFRRLYKSRDASPRGRRMGYVLLDAALAAGLPRTALGLAPAIVTRASGMISGSVFGRLVLPVLAGRPLVSIS